MMVTRGIRDSLNLYIIVTVRHYYPDLFSEVQKLGSQKQSEVFNLVLITPVAKLMQTCKAPCSSHDVVKKINLRHGQLPAFCTTLSPFRSGPEQSLARLTDALCIFDTTPLYENHCKKSCLFFSKYKRMNRNTQNLAK